jgi:formylmethanofuran dehydrogenase subunit C
MYGGGSREAFGLMVSPNPITTNFKLLVSGNNDQRISIRVTDELGRVVFAKSNMPAGEVVVIGDNFRGGTYFAEVMQGEHRKIVKLVKVN